MDLLGWLWVPLSRRQPSEVYRHVWLQIEVLWRSCAAFATEADQRDINELINSRPQFGRSDWGLLNKVEQRIAEHMPETILHSEFLNLLETARRNDHIMSFARSSVGPR